MFNIFGLFKDALFAFTPDGPLFGPARCQVGVIDGDSILTGDRVVAVVDGVGFKESWDKLVPLICADGDLMAQ